EAGAAGMVHNSVPVKSSTGQQCLVNSGGGFIVPLGVAPAPGNNLCVAVEPGNVQGPDPGSVWEVNLDTGRQTLISHGGRLNHPQDVVVEAGGTLIVGNTGSAANGYAGSIIRVNPQTGAQTLVSMFGYNTGLDSIEL